MTLPKSLTIKTGDVSRYVPLVALVSVFVAEILILTISFDTAALEWASSPWLRGVGSSPQILRLLLTVSVVTVLLHGGELARSWDEYSDVGRPARILYLGFHACALAIFAWITEIVFAPSASAVGHPRAWVIAWCVTGMAWFGTWVLATLPRRMWIDMVRPTNKNLYVCVGAGTAIWAVGFLTEALWAPLARATFSVVAWILASIYPHVVSDPAQLIIGTRSFKVLITPQCSGYEGIGLMLAFLAIYFWVCRKELRFPDALVLLPLGAAAIWIVNTLRIVALVAIGTAGWKEIARGGFHSQAGWIAFNVVALAFVAILHRRQYFMIAPVRPAPRRADLDPTTAYLAPLVVIMSLAMITGAFSAGIDWLYPLRVVAACVVLWVFRKSYSNFTWSVSWQAIAIGCATFIVWLALVPDAGGGNDGWPTALGSIPFHWAAAWLVLRVIGYVVTVPLAEELAFRAYLTRRLMHADFHKLPVGLFSWSSFLISSVLFGALHGRLWLAGTIAGMTFALALYQRRALGDAVQAHATTNGLIALYVFATGRWAMWS